MKCHTRLADGLYRPHGPSNGVDFGAVLLSSMVRMGKSASDCFLVLSDDKVINTGSEWMGILSERHS